MAGGGTLRVPSLSEVTVIQILIGVLKSFHPTTDSFETREEFP